MMSFARQLQRRLQSRPLETVDAPQRAAVAALISLDTQALLLMVRAEHPHDPWSGHVAFPGGRCEAGESPLDAALRETREEVGVPLQRGQLLGRLDDIQAIGLGRALPLAISPFVFATQHPPPLQPDPAEVAKTLWVPLDLLRDDARLETLVYEKGDTRRELPCYRYEGHAIWGLTFRMIRQLLRHLPERGSSACASPEPGP